VMDHAQNTLQKLVKSFFFFFSCCVMPTSAFSETSCPQSKW